ncbi:sulfotransferase [Paraglaciecola sp.]|nr:sulfotransferase [Paraglaciecola sp.]
MKTTLQSLQESISNAVDMIERSQLVSDDLLFQQSSKHLTDSLDFTNAKSLLDKCEQVTNSYKKPKPDIRVIHHLACSGGTLISKCISAMPNVYLLSEAHPFSDLHLGTGTPKFLPSDVSALSRHADIPHQPELARKIFLESIKIADNHLTNMGSHLVIRDHTHSDYSTGEKECTHSAIVNVLQSDYNVISLLTIRDPIDSYAALVKNNWLHFSPPTFNEYCRRFNVMLNHFENQHIVRFEDFVEDPKGKMQKICECLSIPYSELFEDIFGVFRVTGDSGRSADIIGSRDRIASEDVLNQCKDSKEYQKICDAGWYNSSEYEPELKLADV